MEELDDESKAGEPTWPLQKPRLSPDGAERACKLALHYPAFSLS